MFIEEGYKAIFDERGTSYHKAMAKYPNVRRNEFQQSLKIADVQPNHTVADFPSGGGYLSRYLDDSNSCICIESSQVFADFCKAKALEVSMLSDETTSLADNSVDRVVSIAGLHHEENKIPLLSEMCRILKPGGIACVADVAANSSVANFLDTIVNEFTSIGHQGSYFSLGNYSDFEQAGFNEIQSRLLNYDWVFESEQHMIDYCRLIFALEANDCEILKGIEEFLGYSEINGKILMPWQLMCWDAKRDY